MNHFSFSALWMLLTTGYGVLFLIAIGLVVWQARTTFIRLRLLRDLGIVPHQQLAPVVLTPVRPVRSAPTQRAPFSQA